MFKSLTVIIIATIVLSVTMNNMLLVESTNQFIIGCMLSFLYLIVFSTKVIRNKSFSTIKKFFLVSLIILLSISTVVIFASVTNTISNSERDIEIFILLSLLTINCVALFLVNKGWK